MSQRDGHVRVLPLHVANKIAAGEVVERPASVVKELVENSIDAGATHIVIAVTQGGRKLVSVRDDGCGMTKDDAILSLERQATSKIRDVDDIERIDTLGFRGEAIPSIASVSRFTLTTRRREADEGTSIQVNAGTIAKVSAAGCPPGSTVEVRDLFCNVPARRKFLRAYATEESHVRTVFTVHALAHPAIGFTLSSDTRELYRLAPAVSLRDRVRDLFGEDFLENMAEVRHEGVIGVSGFIERPNLNLPTRRDQYIFVNGRPASSASLAYAIREAYPHRQGESRPAAILFITLPADQVDVNVHPTKREVRFRNNVAIKQAVMEAISSAIGTSQGAAAQPIASAQNPIASATPPGPQTPPQPLPQPISQPQPISPQSQPLSQSQPLPHPPQQPLPSARPPAPAPTQVEFAVEPDSTTTKPWVWFKFLAATASGYLLVETDSGLVTINPHAARERIAFESLMRYSTEIASQALLIPETVHLTPSEFARVSAAVDIIAQMGFKIEPFGTDTFKIDAVPQLLGDRPIAGILATIARDLADGSLRRSGERWRESLVAKSIARSFAGTPLKMDEASATRLVEELSRCRMPYVCPRGKPILIFTSTRELNRKFARE